MVMLDCFAAGSLATCGDCLLAGAGAVFERLGFGDEGDGLGDLGIPLGADLKAFDLTELRGEEIALDAFLDPIVDAGDVVVGVLDLVGLEELLELLHDGVVYGKVLGDGVGGEIVLAEVEEGVVLEERVLEVIGLDVVDLLVGGDAAAAVYGASGVGEFDFEVGLILGFAAFADVVVVVEGDVVVRALDESPRGGVVVVGGEGEAGVLGDLEDGLDEAFAEGGFADDESTVVILECPGDDLSGGGGVAIDEDNDGVLAGVGAAGGAVDLVGEGASTLRDDDLAFLEELVGHIDGFVEEAAGVAAEVDNEALDVAGCGEFIECLSDFAAGGLDEAGYVDVADAGPDEEGEVYGVVGDFVTDEIEDEGPGGTFALHGDGDVGTFGALEERGDGGGVHASYALGVDDLDDVAGADAGLDGRRAVKGGEDDDLGGSFLVGLGLNLHADAVVLAVLVFAHLGEGLGVVEVGVGVEDVEHAGDGPVVDGLVGLLGVELICIILLDEGVDVGEGMEGVAEGGLVGGGLGGDLLADDGADDGAGGEEDGSGEESASGTDGHELE